MLTITVLGTEVYDESTSEFKTEGDVVLELEHSLISLSKWESEFEKPFLSTNEKSTEEVIAYIRAMTLTPNIPPEVFLKLSEKNFHEINQYVDAKMSATWFNERGGSKSREIVTSELVYYWMTVYGIPFECERWHLNRLFTLIRICNAKQEKPKKMSATEAASQQKQLNAERRQRMNSTG